MTPERWYSCFAVIALNAVLAVAGPGSATAQTVTVFSSNFESGLPAQFTAPGASIEPVQGYAGLGAAGNQFGGSFLRYSATQLQDTQLTLTGLPPHDHVSIGFLLAVIDSWDGTELLQVLVDGNLIFSHWFQIAVGDASSYAAPPGGLLSSGTQLGFSGGTWYNRDRAYDISVDPTFNDIPHTGSSLTVVWRVAPNSGWQGSSDESWAIENVRVDVTTTPTAARSTSWGRVKSLYR